MALNFPDSPQIGQSFRVGEVIYKWNGVSWVSSAQTPSSVYSNTAPDSQDSIIGDIWINSSDNTLYVFNGTTFIQAQNIGSSDDSVKRQPQNAAEATIESHIGGSQVLLLRNVGSSISNFLAGYNNLGILKMYLSGNGGAKFSNQINVSSTDLLDDPSININTQVSDSSINKAALEIEATSQTNGAIGAVVDVSSSTIADSQAIKTIARNNISDSHLIGHDDTSDIKYIVRGDGSASFDGNITALSASNDAHLTTQGDVKNLINSNSPSGQKKIFITNASPTSSGSVGDKVFTNGELTSFISTTTNITVEVHAITGSNGFQPSATIEGINVSNFTLTNGFWVGTANITISGSGTITATHENTDTDTTNVTLGAAPIITSTELLGVGNVYPSLQTALNENQTTTVSVVSDQELNQIQIMSNSTTYDAFDSQAFNNPTGSETSPGVWEYTITANVKNNSNSSSQLLGYIVRGRSTIGSYSSTFNSILDGTTVPTNEVNAIYSDSILPTGTISNIVYPASQLALKNSEQATFNFSTNADNVSFSSSQLSITNPTTIEATKTVERTSGSYNTSNNLSVLLTKETNGKTRTINAAIFIANVAASISVSGTSTPLRSGGSHGSSVPSYGITLNSNQRLQSASMDAPVGSFGSFVQASWGSQSNGTVWVRSLQVDDDQTKGTFNWTSISFTNMSGLTTTTVTNDTYTLGGFIQRSFYVGPDAANNLHPNYNPEISGLNPLVSLLGTNITNTSNLVATLPAGDLDYFNNVSDNSNGTVSPPLFSYSIVEDNTNISNVVTPITNIAGGNSFRLTGTPSPLTTSIQITIEETV